MYSVAHARMSFPHYFLLARFLYIRNKSRCIKITAVYTWNVRFVKGALRYDERNYLDIKIVDNNRVSYEERITLRLLLLLRA